MSTPIVFNGQSYTIPAVGDASWGTNVSDYLIAIATGALQKTGGAFTLSAEVDFGGSFGLKALYLKSKTANVAAAGMLRLANTDAIAWRNGANGADLALDVSSDLVRFAGVQLVNLSATQTLTGKSMSGSANTFTNIPGSAVTSFPASGLTGTVSPANGGTGVANNSASTITISGSFGLILTLTGLSSLTLPTVGTLATLAGSEIFTNKTLTAPAVTGGSFINMLTQAAIRFNDDAGGDYIALQAPTGVTTYTAKLPATQGGAGTSLQNDGSGNLSWTAAPSNTLNTGFMDVGDASNARTATNTLLLGDVKASTVSQSYAVTAAAPGVFTVAAAPATGSKAYVTVTQNGFTANTTYYVTNISGTTFKLATTLSNALAAVNITSSSNTAGVILTGGLQFSTGRLSPVTAEATLPTVTWTNLAGTNPSTVTSSGYKWSQNGNIVTVWWRVLYTNAGNLITNGQFSIPADLPTPVIWTAGGAAGYEYWGSSFIAASGVGAQTLPPGLTYMDYNDDVASTWTIHYVGAASGANVKFWGGQIQYHTIV